MTTTPSEMVDLIHRASDEIGVPIHRLTRDAFLAWGQAGKVAGVSTHTIHRVGGFSALKSLAEEVSPPPPPRPTDVTGVSPEDGQVPIDELIEQRVKAAERKSARSSAHTRVIELPPEPVGVLVLGDPHLDNEGCDWGLLVRHVELAREHRLLAACVGDMQDNWIGRLQRLYAKSSILASDGWRLSKWLLEQMEWLALVGGNHDGWAHAAGANPLRWISEQAKVLCYADDEIRMTLRWRGREDLAPLIWLMRHDFRGRSWFHPTHGAQKEAMLDGKAHILTAGHIHQWGQLSTEHRHHRVAHAFRVRGYKRNDEHARALGFFEQQHGAAALVILRPEAEDPGRVLIYWDIEEGCRHLEWLRAR